MRIPSILFGILILISCNKTPATQNPPIEVSTQQAHAFEPTKASVDSVEQYLLTSAASDFHMHGPFFPLLFRNVRMGHKTSADGKRQYSICGQYLPAKQGEKTEWTAFSTIKTSGYEQYIGDQSATFCQGSNFSWDTDKDLSNLLQDKYDVLK